MTTTPPDAAELARRLRHAAESGSQADVLGATLREVDQLFADHQDRVYAYCLRFVGRPEDAVELAQDTLLLAYQKLPSFRGEAAFSTWLFKIARYNCLNHTRKRRDTLADDGIIELEDDRRSVLSAIGRQERENLLAEAAAAVLDPLEQEAVHLRYVEHLGIDAITETLGIEASSGARGVLQRCKRKLRRELDRRLEELGHGLSFIRGTMA